MASGSAFSVALLEWFDTHGRHDLPWQRNRSAYSVWVSEIMLQQTQVATAVPFYERFITRFPDVGTLSAASLDDVLALWSGLGYYARARNLHKAAGIVQEQYEGIVPDDFDSLVSLPGVGRSTAGAILSIVFDQRYPILDGNVKRVLTRHAGIKEWPGKSAVTKLLWSRAEELTPHQRVADYTQAIMDLGATLCTRAKPACMDCPVNEGCIANSEGLQSSIPVPRPKKTKPRRSVRMLILQNDTGEILLEKRPPTGIWAGLYSLPELPEDETSSGWTRDFIGTEPKQLRALERISHSFTHFDLEIEPLHARVSGRRAVMDRADLLWYKPMQSGRPGMPAPVSRLLDTLA